MSCLYKIFIFLFIFITPYVFAASGDVIYANNSIFPCQIGENVQSLSDASSCVKQLHTTPYYTVTYMYSRVSGTNTIYQYFNYYDSQRNTNSTSSFYFRMDMGADCAFISADLVCGLPCNTANRCLAYYAENVCSSPSYIQDFVYTDAVTISYQCVQPSPIECQFGSDCEEIIANNTDAPIIYIGIKGDEGVQGVQGEIGLTGEQGEQGDAFQFSDFTTEQLALLKGADGDSFDDSNLVLGIQNNKADISELFIETYLLQTKDEIIAADVSENTNALNYLANNPSSDGIDGSDGAQGLQGEQGVSGQDGQDGEKGEKGDRGEKGDQGDKGQKGDNGIDGAQGTQGLAGQNGINGVDGTNGTNGTNGRNGTNGADGNNGLDGLNGEGCTTFNDPQNSHQVVIECGEFLTFLRDGLPGTDGQNVDTQAVVDAVNEVTNALTASFSTGSVVSGTGDYITLFDQTNIDANTVKVNALKEKINSENSTFYQSIKDKFSFNVTGSGYAANNLELGKWGTYNISISRYADHFGGIGNIIMFLATLLALSIVLSGVRL